MLGIVLAAAALYPGPETTLPLVSFLAGLVGIVLIFWRSLITRVRRIARRLFRRAEPVMPLEEPADGDPASQA